MSAIITQGLGTEIIQWDGNPITKPGIYSGVPMQTYHQQLTDTPSFSSSQLRRVEDKTLKHLWDTLYLNPDAEPWEQSEAMLFGRAVHHLFTGERERFFDLFAIRPETYPNDESKKWNANSTDCKNWLAARALEGRDVLTQAQLERIKGMATEVANHHLVKQGSLHGLVEHTLVWKDPITGIWLKSRPDNLHLLSETTIVDLKTCEDAGWEACSRSMNDFDLHMQLALVSVGVEILTGRKPTGYDLLFVEKKRPHAVAQRPVDLHAIDMARRQLRRAINAVAIALETNNWSGYEAIDEDRPLTLPPWRLTRLAKEAENKTLPLPNDPPWRPTIPDQRDATSTEQIHSIS